MRGWTDFQREAGAFTLRPPHDTTLVPFLSLSFNCAFCEDEDEGLSLLAPCRGTGRLALAVLHQKQKHLFPSGAHRKTEVYSVVLLFTAVASTNGARTRLQDYRSAFAKSENFELLTRSTSA